MTLEQYSSASKTETGSAPAQSKLSHIYKYWFYLIFILVLVACEAWLRFSQETILLKLPFVAFAFYVMLINFNIMLLKGNYCETRTLETKIIFYITSVYFIGLFVIEIIANQHRNFFYLLYIAPLISVLLLWIESPLTQQSEEDNRYRYGLRVMSIISFVGVILFYIMLSFFNGTDKLFNIFIYNPMLQTVIGISMMIWLYGKAKLRLDNYRILMAYNWLIALVLYVISAIILLKFNSYLIGENDLAVIIIYITSIILILINGVFVTKTAQGDLSSTSEFFLSTSSLKGMFFALITLGCTICLI